MLTSLMIALSIAILALQAEQVKPSVAFNDMASVMLIVAMLGGFAGALAVLSFGAMTHQFSRNTKDKAAATAVEPSPTVVEPSTITSAVTKTGEEAGSLATPAAFRSGAGRSTTSDDVLAPSATPATQSAETKAKCIHAHLTMKGSNKYVKRVACKKCGQLLSAWPV